MNKELSRRIIVYTGIVLLFAALAYGFVPQVLSGKIVNQSDIASWKGMANEAVSYNSSHPDDQTAWTGAMFSGMPTTATIDDFEGDWTQKIYKFLLTGRRPASYLFIALVGAFLLMLSMKINIVIAVAGAIAIAFCSYNMQIIQVGHNTKMQAIAFLPWVLAALIFTYRAALSKVQTRREWLPKTVLGSVLFAFALSMQIKANHLQITYYLAIIIFVYAIALLISICADKEKRSSAGRYFAASALLLVVGLIGIATNANKLIPTYEYTPYTMRGGSELSSDDKNHNKKGLDLDYATAWSYGIEEMPNLLIPDFNGGSSSGELGMDSETGRLLKTAGQPNLKETLKHMPLYWGPQPFTAGPMYMGAITIFLFILGLILCKGRDRWWILVATVIAILLSWGSHFMWFTRLWFEYAPLYNKFRTVSMALIVLQVTLPLLGFLVIDRIIKGRYSREEFTKAGVIAWILTGGFCLLCMIFPGIAGSFTGAVDAGQPDILIDAFITDRQSLMKSDALRSLTLVSVLFLLILWAYQIKDTAKSASRMHIVAFALILLVCIDMMGVGKRYLNKDHFVTKRDFNSAYTPRTVDKIIHEDKDPHYRVLDISVNTFNDAIQSYHHKTIGGYSPVKLQRYQDLIEKYLAPEIRKIQKCKTFQELDDCLSKLKITSLLNGKYIILDGDYQPIINSFAMGNCWYVDTLTIADSPDEEIAMLASTDLQTAGIVGRDFASFIRESNDKSLADSDIEHAKDTIFLSSYSPKELRYSFRNGTERTAVFSEIYYPKGWKAWIEPVGTYGTVRNGLYVPSEKGKAIDLFRVDWMLRAANIPQGEGQLIMRFEPESYQVGANVSRASSIILILLLILSCTGIILPSFRKGI